MDDYGISFFVSFRTSPQTGVGIPKTEGKTIET